MGFILVIAVLYVIGSLWLAEHAYRYFNSITFGILTFFGCLMFTPIMAAIVLADTF